MIININNFGLNHQDTKNSVLINNAQWPKQSKVLLQGNSGKGKSSLLRALMLTNRSFTGSISVGNFTLKNLKESFGEKWRQNTIAYVPQGLQLIPHCTAIENIQLKNSLLNHFSKSTILEMATTLELGTKLDQKTYTLSYGEQQRVSIIRALCQPFHWLLMDEPFSHLDTKMIDKVIGLILDSLHTNQAGLILTSHHPISEKLTFDIVYDI